MGERARSRARGTQVLALASLASIALTAPAAAAPGATAPERLEFHAPAGCPDPAAFRADLGERRADPIPPEVALAVDVVAIPRGFRGVLHIADGAPRTVEGESCAEVVRALAL